MISACIDKSLKNISDPVILYMDEMYVSVRRYRFQLNRSVMPPLPLLHLTTSFETKATLIRSFFTEQRTLVLRLVSL